MSTSSQMTPDCKYFVVDVFECEKDYLWIVNMKQLFCHFLALPHHSTFQPSRIVHHLSKAIIHICVWISSFREQQWEETRMGPFQNQLCQVKMYHMMFTSHKLQGVSLKRQHSVPHWIPVQQITWIMHSVWFATCRRNSVLGKLRRKNWTVWSNKKNFNSLKIVLLQSYEIFICAHQFHKNECKVRNCTRMT